MDSRSAAPSGAPIERSPWSLSLRSVGLVACCSAVSSPISPLAVEIEQRGVEAHHALGHGALPDEVGEFLELERVENVLARQRRHRHDLTGDHARLAALVRHQTLAHHAAQVLRQLGADTRLRLGRKRK